MTSHHATGWRSSDSVGAREGEDGMASTFKTLPDYPVFRPIGRRFRPIARRELRRRQVIERTVRPALVVIPSPGRDLHPRLEQRGEVVVVQTFIPESPVE